MILILLIRAIGWWNSTKLGQGVTWLLLKKYPKECRDVELL